MHVLSPDICPDSKNKTSSHCLQAHVLRTRHWTGNNIWSPYPVLEAHLLDMEAAQWQPLESLLRSLLQAVALPVRVCECLPSSNGRGTVVVEASEAALGRYVLQQAMELLALPQAQCQAQWADTLRRIRLVIDEECLGPSTACIANAAMQRHLPAYRLFPKGNLVQLGMGAAQQRIWTAESDGTGAIAQDIAADKALTKRLLANAGIPTPQGEIASSPTHAWQIAQRLGLPVVVKPLDGNRARGVSLDLCDQAAIESAWLRAKREGTQVLVERCIQGHEHRVLVVGNQVVAASRGETLSVVGDGHSTVAQLVEAQINQHSRCLVDNTLEHIDLSTNTKVHVELQSQQMDVNSIPQAQQSVVVLRTGNHTVDCTDLVHPDIAQHAVMAARTIGLDIAGLDMVLQDISQPLLPQGGAIVEVNAGPSLLMHLYPVHGQPRAVGEAICNHLFPSPNSGRIPLVGILANVDAGLRIGTWLAAHLDKQGFRTGLANGNMAYLHGAPLLSPAAPAPSAGQRVLMHRAVTAAVIAQDFSMAADAGWAYTQCDVAIICPPTAVMDIQLQRRVLAAQLRSVRPDGIAIVTPSCPDIESLALTCQGQVMWVDTDENHPVLQAHRRMGGRIAFVREGGVVCVQDGREQRLAITAAQSAGEADTSPHEWLAMAAACWALEAVLPTQQVQPVALI